MERTLRFKSKKGMSTIVTTVILIALSIVALAVVWGFLSNFINKEIGKSQSCFGNYDKVTINNQYTCYEEVSGGYALRFSLIIGDVEVDSVTVSIASRSSIKSYKITNDSQTISGLAMYPSGNTSIILPEENSGLTYRLTGLTSKIDSIQIAPTIGETQCEVSDSLSDIYNCAVYVD